MCAVGDFAVTSARETHCHNASYAYDVTIGGTIPRRTMAQLLRIVR